MEGLWEHNEGSGIWSYIVDGNIVADVEIVDGKGFEASIYDEEEKLAGSKVFSLLPEAKTFVETVLKFTSPSDLKDHGSVLGMDNIGEAGLITGRRSRILRSRSNWDKEDWRAGERRNPQMNRFRNAEKGLLRKIRSGNVDPDGASDIVFGDSERY
jgi:hypothetical protein